MILSDICNSSNYDPIEARKRFQARKLRTLNYLRDRLERKLAALDASIETLKNQISRDDNN